MEIDDVLTLIGLTFIIFAIYYVIARTFGSDGECCDGNGCDNCPFSRCHPQSRVGDMEQ